VDAQRAVVAFDAHQAQDILLAAAFADGHGVPERRHRRWDLDLPIHFRTFDREGSGRLVNVSRGGCCLQLDAPLRQGARIYVVGGDFVVDGVVRWARAGSRLLGVEFARFQEELAARLVDVPSSLDPASTPGQ
jgi:hypothetical protein